VPESDEYQLSDDELDSIFYQTIVPVLFDTAPLAEYPLAILIGAQPGAGKSRAGRMAMAESGQPMVEIIGDDLRAFHPCYSELMARDPMRMPDATAQASGAWVERCIQFAAEQCLSVLVEGTFRDAAVPWRTAEVFRQHGFHVQVHLLAVAEVVSRLSIADRFVSGMSKDGQARFTSADAHARAVWALPTTLTVLEQNSSPVSEFILRDRDEVLLRYGLGDAASMAASSVIIRRELAGESLTAADCQEWLRQEQSVSEFLQAHYAADENVKVLLSQLDRDRAAINARIDDAARAAQSVMPLQEPWINEPLAQQPLLLRYARSNLDAGVSISGADKAVRESWTRAIGTGALRVLLENASERHRLIDGVMHSAWRRISETGVQAGLAAWMAGKDGARLVTYFLRECHMIFDDHLVQWARDLPLDPA
jgi:hypothetical protein